MDDSLSHFDDSNLPAEMLTAPVFWQPDRLTKSAWIGHIPFAFWVVGALRPATLVELGTHTGVSYCAFCQAVAQLALPTRCFAVDTWKGDPHAGYYSEEVYEELSKHHDDRYGSFSHLLRTTFDEAVKQFPDGSIDLLHIDGYHTYESVKHDFDTWRPKLSNRALVLFHDVTVKEREFGVWRLWGELAKEYPNFTFTHSYGLGVLGIGSDLPSAVSRLLAAAKEPTISLELQTRFARLGDSLVKIAQDQQIANLRDDIAGIRRELDVAKRELKDTKTNSTRSLQETRNTLAQVQAEANAARTQIANLTDRAKATEVELARRTDEAEGYRAKLDKVFSDLVGREIELAARTLQTQAKADELEVRRQRAAYDAVRFRVALHKAARNGPKARKRVASRLAASTKKVCGVLAGSGQSSKTKREANLAEQLLASGLFDPAWYLSSYQDVCEAGFDPVIHYLRHGAAEGRDPSAQFSTNGYKQLYRDVAAARVNPLVHFLEHGIDEGRKATLGQARPRSREILISTVRGDRAWDPRARTVILCAHVAGHHLFGGERSFADIAEGISGCGFNIVITLPQAHKEYIHELRRWCQSIRVFGYTGWTAGYPIDEAVVSAFSRILRESRADVVHVNTIMLREPLLAAKRLSIPAVVHVRELIEQDSDLAQSIGEPADEIVRRVLVAADYIFANSATTAARFAKPLRTFVIPNTVDVAALDMPNEVDQRAVRFALISSNLPKKGLRDFVELARLCRTEVPAARFVLIGPENDHVKRLQLDQANGSGSDNLLFSGYQLSPRAAVAQANVILNFSNFAESFGRTVLEAMAARRPVIAYTWGALPELVRHGETGFLIPYKNPAAAVEFVRQMVSHPEMIAKLGEAGRTIAVERYSKENYREEIKKAYDAIFGVSSDATTGNGSGVGAPQARERGVVTRPARAVTKPSSAAGAAPCSLRIAYFMWHFPVPSETFVLNELRVLIAKGYDVLVFCRQSPHPDFIPDVAVRWERVNSPEELSNRLVQTGRQIVHSHFIYPTVTEFTWPACELAGIPFTFIAHAQDIFRHENDARNRIAEVVHSKVCRRVFVPSRFHRDYLVERGVPHGKIVINPNGIDPSLFDGGRVANDGPRRTPKRICAVHRFAEKKGLENLVRAAQILERDGIEVNLYGYGPLQAHYEAIIAQNGIRNVHIRGAVRGREHLLQVFREHDLFVCPSIRAADGDMDGVPTVLMEAMAAGLPVLATPLSGIPDLVVDGITGFLCEAKPDAIAEAVRKFYTLPGARLAAIADNAQHHVWDHYNSKELVNVLLRVWHEQTIDLIIVSWNNSEQLREVVRRLYALTSLPFHLVICDNASNDETVSFLDELYARKDNVTLIHNDRNTMVGPGTNRALDASWSDYSIYICSKEGFVLSPGWEVPFVKYMNTHHDVGLAGTLGYSPSYLTGKDYPKGVREFPKFRNVEFASKNPDRLFRHVQGGFFVLRREMYDEIGGFSEEVPHNYTDVEYSYYAESCGWKLGEVPHLLALYSKTRPGLSSRVDENVFAVHPPTLEELPWLDAIAGKQIVHCNLCGWHGPKFAGTDGGEICPSCESSPRDRTFYRWLADSTWTHRGLHAIGINVPATLAKIWKQHFRGPALEKSELLNSVKNNRRTNDGQSNMELAYLVDAISGTEDDRIILQGINRLLGPAGTLIVQNRYDEPLAPKEADGTPMRYSSIVAFLESMGYRQIESILYRSAVVRYDWSRLLVCARQ